MGNANRFPTKSACNKVCSGKYVDLPKSTRLIFAMHSTKNQEKKSCKGFYASLVNLQHAFFFLFLCRRIKHHLEMGFCGSEPDM